MSPAHGTDAPHVTDGMRPVGVMEGNIDKDLDLSKGDRDAGLNPEEADVL